MHGTMKSVYYFGVICMSCCNILIKGVFGGIETSAHMNKSEERDKGGTTFKALLDITERNDITAESGIFQSDSISSVKQGEVVIDI